MTGINSGKVIAGGLLAGLVLNVLDIASNMFLMAEDFRANMARLNLDAAAAETPMAIATWVIIDFLLGILLVFTYALIRPRLGPGVQTAIYAGLIPFFAICLVMYGFTTIGFFSSAMFWKSAVASLIIMCAGSVAGAWAYKEA